MYRSLLPTVFVISSLTALSNAAQPSTDIIETELGPKEYIAASWVSDEPTVILAIADETTGETRIVQIEKDLERFEYRIPGFRVNRLQVIGSDFKTKSGMSLFLCGGSATGFRTKYVCRLYSSEDGQLIEDWDSEELEISLESDSAVFYPSNDGKYWGVLAPVTDDSMKMYIGFFPLPVPEMTVELRANWPNGSPPPSVDVDNFDFVFVDTGPKGPLVALIWNGLVYIVGPGEPAVKAMIVTHPTNVAKLHWQSSGRLLWLETNNDYRGFKLLPNLANNQETEKLTEKTRIERISGYFERFRPIAGGEIALIGGPKNQSKMMRRMKPNKIARVLST